MRKNLKTLKLTYPAGLAVYIMALVIMSSPLVYASREGYMAILNRYEP